MSSNGRFTFRVRAPQDFYGGLTLIALALFAIWAGSDLPGQHGFSFGPGTAPRIFATLLAVAGAIVAAGGLMVDGPKIEGFAIRGPALICAGILFFSLASGLPLGAETRALSPLFDEHLVTPLSDHRQHRKNQQHRCNQQQSG